MPALEIDPAALPPDEQREIELLLAGPTILAEPESGGLAVGWLILAALGAAALGSLFFWQGLGVVTSPGSASARTSSPGASPALCPRPFRLTCSRWRASLPASTVRPSIRVIR